MGLTTQEIKEMSSALNEAVDVSLDALPREQKVKVASLVMGLIHSEKPIRLFSPEAAERLLIIGFEDPEILDFWQTLEIQFFARWGNAREQYPKLVDTLAFAIGYSHKKISAMPEPVASRLPELDMLEEFFSDNAWAVMMAALMIYMKLPTFLNKLKTFSRLSDAPPSES